MSRDRALLGVGALAVAGVLLWIALAGGGAEQRESDPAEVARVVDEEVAEEDVADADPLGGGAWSPRSEPAAARGATSAERAAVRAPRGVERGALRVVATVEYAGRPLRRTDLTAVLRYLAPRPGAGESKPPRVAARYEAALTTDRDGRIEWTAPGPAESESQPELEAWLLLFCAAPPARANEPAVRSAERVVDGVLDLGVIELEPAPLVARGMVVDPDGRPLAGAEVGPVAVVSRAATTDDRAEVEDDDAASLRDLVAVSGPRGGFLLHSLRRRPPSRIAASLGGYTGQPVLVPPQKGTPRLTIVLWRAEPLHGVLALPAGDAKLDLEVQALGRGKDGEDVLVDRAEVAPSGAFTLTGGAPVGTRRLRLAGNSTLASDLMLVPAGLGADAEGRPAERFLLPADATTCEVQVVDAAGVRIRSFALQPHGTHRSPMPSSPQLYVLRGASWAGTVKHGGRRNGYVEITSPRTTALLEVPFHVRLDVRFTDPDLEGARIDFAYVLPREEFGGEPSGVRFSQMGLGFRRDEPLTVQIPRDGEWELRFELRVPAAGGGERTEQRTVGPIELTRGVSPVVVEL